MDNKKQFDCNHLPKLFSAIIVLFMETNYLSKYYVQFNIFL